MVDRRRWTRRPSRCRSATTASAWRPGEEQLVFDRFWRADPARARTSGGTGLGLAIALEDARLHGGWLEAWGEPGRGSVFRLTLPRAVGGDLHGSPLPLRPLPSTAVADGLRLPVTAAVRPGRRRDAVPRTGRRAGADCGRSSAAARLGGRADLMRSQMLPMPPMPAMLPSLPVLPGRPATKRGRDPWLSQARRRTSPVAGRGWLAVAAAVARAAVRRCPQVARRSRSAGQAARCRRTCSRCRRRDRSTDWTPTRSFWVSCTPARASRSTPRPPGSTWRRRCSRKLEGRGRITVVSPAEPAATQLPYRPQVRRRPAVHGSHRRVHRAAAGHAEPDRPVPVLAGQPDLQVHAGQVPAASG